MIPAIVITADLIWWGSDFVPLLEKRIQKELHITSEKLIFHASHNHCGPQTSANFTTFLGLKNEEYLYFLEDRVIQGIRIAKANLEDVEVESCSGTAHIGINRCLIQKEKIDMAPNSLGPLDSDVIMIKCPMPSRIFFSPTE